MSNIRDIVVEDSDRIRTKAMALADAMLTQDFDTVASIQRDVQYSRTERGLTHLAGAQLKLTDYGDFLARTPNGTSLLLSNKHSSLLLYGKFVNINSQQLKMRLSPDGFRLNGHYLNPEVVSGAEIPLVTSSGTKQVPLFIPVQDDLEFDLLLQELAVL